MPGFTRGCALRHHRSLMVLPLTAEARDGTMLQCQASAFKLSETINKPIKDKHQAIASFALRDRNASNFIKIGET